MAKRKKANGHYCKVCGMYRANEKFSGKGHAAHICKDCAKLSPAQRAEEMTLNRLCNLPWYLSKEQIKWLKNRTRDSRPAVREEAQEQYDMRFKRQYETDERLFGRRIRPASAGTSKEKSCPCMSKAAAHGRSL